ncbi:MAG: hypothetical protein KatS3mg082_2651 [Nitrospiraceae bacterium]|nr:MAG: hypothetical protein KatS3mg082_2651 [Nitrospiraceae bacterium]
MRSPAELWRAVVRRAASGDRSFCFDEAREWPRADFEHLVRLGILREGPLAASVVCDACGKMHRADVLWEPSVRDPLGKRAYVQCEDEGPVHVPEFRLRQWVVDGSVIAKSLAAAMSLSGTVEEILAGRVWRLGRRRLAGRFRDVFLSMAGTSEHARTAEAAARHLTVKDGILLAGEARLNSNVDRLTVLDVAEVVELGAEGLIVDLDYIEDALPRDRAIKEDKIRSLAVPEGITWPEITLEVGESSLRVLARGQSWDVDLEAAGFADTRRKSGEVDQLFQILSLFALRRGCLALAEVKRRKNNTDGFRRQISNLRKRLGNLIPAEGESILWDPAEEAYTCCFRIQRSGDVALPQPSNDSWMSFEFVERRDGRIAVGVKANQLQRAKNARTGETGAAEHQETLWKEYSLLDLGLARDVDRLLPEGQALIYLLRAGGRLARPGDDMAILKLNQWLRDRTGLAGDPLQFSEATGAWIAAFDCSSDRLR